MRAGPARPRRIISGLKVESAITSIVGWKDGKDAGDERRLEEERDCRA